MSLPRYSEYKHSEIPWMGKIPSGWSVCPLISTVSERSEPNVGMREDNLLSLSYGRIVQKDIGSNDGLLPESFETYQIIRPGDIVLRLTDLQNDKRSLRSAIAEEQGIITSAYLAIQPKGIERRFLAYLLRAYDLAKVFYSMGGGLRQSMKFSDMKRMPIIVPSTSEQVAIACFLDRETAKIDALIAEQEKLLTLLAEKRQATIAQAVTRGINPNVPMKDSGVPWIGDIPWHWSVVPLAYRYTVQLGKMLDSAKISGEHLRPYLRVFDVQWGSINTDELPMMDFDEDARQKFRLIPGDILVNEGGSYPGRSAIWKGSVEECYYQKALHRLRPICTSEDTSEFFYYAMIWAANQGVFVAGGNETTIEHLPAERLRRYRFAFPSRIDEQKEIASFLNAETAKIDLLKAEAEHAIALLKERRSALISAAVTGQIDVRVARALPEEQTEAKAA